MFSSKKISNLSISKCLSQDLLTTVYTCFGGLDIHDQANLVMSSDIGPNKNRHDMAYYPMNEGFLVSPSVNILMGANSKKQIHVRPFEFKHNKSSKYFIILCELLVRCDKLKIPCLFSLNSDFNKSKPGNYSRYVTGEYYVINDMDSFILRSVMVKKLSHEEFLDFNKKELNSSK